MTILTLIGGVIWPLLAIPDRTNANEPERKAVAYLAAEVPRWSRENHCYSCHNNADAARALFRAKAAGLAFDGAALAETVGWLTSPGRWDKNGADGPISDKRLARIEFAAALATAVETGASRDRAALRVAADRLAGDQAADGSWPIDDAGALGSPAACGQRLGTALALRVLVRDDPRRHDERIARGRNWLRSARIASTVDAAAVLLAGDDGTADAIEAKRARKYLRDSQSKSGGWGPYPETPTEPFDTALAVLALAPFRDEPGLAPSLERARAALVALQREDGSWPETTRPAGGESYAQRISTTGWATLALLATRR